MSREDRRKALIHLTAAAKMKLEQLSALHRRQFAHFGPEIGDLLERLNVAGKKL